MRLSLKPLAASDTERAAALFRDAMLTVACFDPSLHTPAEDCAFWRDRIFPHCTVIGAFVGAELAGQAAFAAGWLHQLHVAPAWQTHGIGAALIGAVKAQMADIQLWTFQANVAARRFYERHGFIAMAFTDGAGNEEKLPDVRYRWCR